VAVVRIPQSEVYRDTLASVCLAIGTVLFVVGLVWFCSGGLTPDNGGMPEAQATYCHRVASGAWPDYRHTYAKECRATFGTAKPFVPYTER